jgi:hypothetical protein
METTPFMKFWGSLNDYLESAQLPLLTFGSAHRLWSETTKKAIKESVSNRMKELEEKRSAE